MMFKVLLLESEDLPQSKKGFDWIVIFLVKLNIFLMFSLAMLLGPLWGGGSLPWLPALFSVPLALMTIGMVNINFHNYFVRDL